MSEGNRPEMIDRVLVALQTGRGPRDAAILRSEFQRKGHAVGDGPTLGEYEAATSLWKELEERGAR